jgi:hypothetical protein
MQSKEIRTLIIGLIILIIGMFLLMQIAAGILGSYESSLLGPFQGLSASVQSMGTLIVMGGVALVILLLPLYIWKRKKEKREQLELQHQREAALQRQEQLRRERLMEQQLYRQQLRQRIYQRQPRYRYAQNRRQTY